MFIKYLPILRSAHLLLNRKITADKYCAEYDACAEDGWCSVVYLRQFVMAHMAFSPAPHRHKYTLVHKQTFLSCHPAPSLRVFGRELRRVNSLASLTRHPHYRGDKLSRLAPPSEFIECPSPRVISSLAVGGRMAPVLPVRKNSVATPYLNI